VIRLPDEQAGKHPDCRVRSKLAYHTLHKDGLLLLAMTVANILIIASLRLALFIGCRLTVLPLLQGEARHASLDEMAAADGVELSELPTPVSAASSGRGPLTRNSLQPSEPIATRITKSIKDPRQASSQVFSLCFEESAILFVLVLLEATGTISTEALHRNWTFSLSLVVALAVVLIREFNTMQKSKTL